MILPLFASALIAASGMELKDYGLIYGEGGFDQFVHLPEEIRQIQRILFIDPGKSQ
jgi:hypothetical protein